MADSKSTPQYNATRAPQGKQNGAKKSYEEELKDDKFQGTGDSELDTAPPVKDKGDEVPGRNRKSHGAESDSDTDNPDGQ